MGMEVKIFREKEKKNEVQLNNNKIKIANISTLVLQTAAASIPDCHSEHSLHQSLTLNKKTSHPCDDTKHPLRDV